MFNQEALSVEPIITPRHPASSEIVAYDGLAFKHRTSLHLWGTLAAIGGGISVVYYLLLQVDLWWLDGPTRAEHTTLGVYFAVWGLFMIANTVALMYRSALHPMRPSTAWVATGAASAFMVLFAVTSAWGAISSGDTSLAADGVERAWTALLFNPFTYAVATPTVATIATERSVVAGPLRLAAALLGCAVLTPLLASVLT